MATKGFGTLIIRHKVRHKMIKGVDSVIKSESTIQSEIMLELSKKGHTVWRSNAGKIKTHQGYVVRLFPEGFPDLVGFRKNDGKFFVIEVKNANGKLREAQKRFAKFAEDKPILYGVARSPEDALKIIGVD